MLGWLSTLITALHCPYLDNDCPKLEDVKSIVDRNARRLDNVEKLLYIIIGMIAVEWGVSLWVRQ